MNLNDQTTFFNLIYLFIYFLFFYNWKMVNYEKKEIIDLGKEENNYFFDNFFICFIKVVVLIFF